MPSTTYRRFRKKDQLEDRVAIHKLVGFKLANEHYAIAISQVRYILNEFITQGTLKSGHSLVRHHNEVITLIDLSQGFQTIEPEAVPHYLIVCTTESGDLLGLPVVEIPIILEIPADQFRELPQLHQREIGKYGVEKLISTPTNATVFYLNVDRFTVNLL